jgi:hypothetical protein
MAKEQNMVGRIRPGARRVALLVSVLLGAAYLVSPSLSGADVTAVIGEAYGYSFNVTTPGGPSTRVPTPLVTLPPAGSSTPITATAGRGSAIAGPATLAGFSGLDVSTQGTLGASGSVTSSATVSGLNTTNGGQITATSLSSTCTASSTGTLTGSTTVAGGMLQTDSGDDNPDNDIPDHPPVIIPIPDMPSANQTFEGHIHVNNTESFRVVFNEQITNGDGSLTVNAAHFTYLGPLTTGDFILGHSRCGVTVSQATTTTTTAAITTTTAGNTTTTAGNTTTTAGNTTTTAGNTTTTAGNTTTTAGNTTTTAGNTTTTTGGGTTTTTGGGTTTTTTGGGTTTTTGGGTTTTTGRVGTPFPAFITTIICGVLQRLLAIPFFRPFLSALATAFGCSAA